MDQIITITEKAQGQISKIFQDSGDDANGKGLRIAITGGGCSGLSYSVDFGEKKEKDNIINLGDVDVLIDPKSTIYLKGVTLDFQDGLNGKGFVFENPNAKNTCGCGESFTV